MITRTIYVLIRLLYVFIDVLGVFGAIFLACWLCKTKFPLDLRALFLDTTNPFYIVFLGWLIAVLFFNDLHKLYETRREFVERHEIGQVIRSVFLAAVALVAFVYSVKVDAFPRSAFLLMIVFTMIILALWRIIKRWFVNTLVAGGYNNAHVLIIGAGKVGLMLASEIAHRPRLGMRIAGFLDDNKITADLGGAYQVIGRLADLRRVAPRNFISKIFITIHPEGHVFHDLLEAARELKLAVRVVPYAFDQATTDLVRYNIGYIPVLEYSDIGHQRRQFGKRAFDMLVSFLGIVLLAPFFAVIAALIKLDSPGPVFYFSRRYGYAGQVFRMWKFRSMVADADQKLSALKDKNEADGPIFKIRQDPRVTPLGRFLRKYSLDELPQIINVFLGDMSLVGPRPFPVGQLDAEDLEQLRRLEFRPGITGLWQVRGRSDVPFSQLIKWDGWYINNWSFSLDFEILFETIPVVLKGKGAY